MIIVRTFLNSKTCPIESTCVMLCTKLRFIHTGCGALRCVAASCGIFGYVAVDD